MKFYEHPVIMVNILQEDIICSSYDNIDDFDWILNGSGFLQGGSTNG